MLFLCGLDIAISEEGTLPAAGDSGGTVRYGYVVEGWVGVGPALLVVKNRKTEKPPGDHSLAVLT